MYLHIAQALELYPEPEEYEDEEPIMGLDIRSAEFRSRVEQWTAQLESAGATTESESATLAHMANAARLQVQELMEAAKVKEAEASEAAEAAEAACALAAAEAAEAVEAAAEVAGHAQTLTQTQTPSRLLDKAQPKSREAIEAEVATAAAIEAAKVRKNLISPFHFMIKYIYIDE